MLKNKLNKQKEIRKDQFDKLIAFINCFEKLGVSILKLSKMMLQVQESIVSTEKIVDCRFKELETRISSHIDMIEKNLGIFNEEEKKKVSH